MLSPWAARPGAATSSLGEKKGGSFLVQPSRKGSASSPQGSNLHILGCRGSCSELPGKKHLSSKSSVHQSVHTKVSSGPSMAWAAPLELANIPRHQPSHHLFGAGEEQGQEQTWRCSEVRTHREIPADGKLEQSEKGWSRFWCRAWVTPGLGFSCANE